MVLDSAARPSSDPASAAAFSASDAAVIDQGVSVSDLLALPLWVDENPLLEDWQKARKILETGPVDQSFWIDWYERFLNGEPQNRDMLDRIALIEPEVWDAGVEAVAGEIAGIEAEFAVQATPNAEDIRVNDDARYEAFPRSTLPVRTLKDANQRIGDVIRQIREAQSDNQYTALAREADLLEDVQARYGDNALRLYEVSHKVVRHIGHHMADGLVPENDNLIGDITGDLQNNADDIRNFDAEVRKTVDARAKLRFERLSDEELSRVIELTKAVAERSEAKLARELLEDARVVEQGAEPSEDTIDIWYRLGSRLVRVVVLGGKLLRDVSEALGYLGGIGGGVAALWWMIRALLGL